MGVALSLAVTHGLMEIFYILIGCTPMVIINIFCILAYIISAGIAIKGDNTLIIVWIMVLEVYIHVILTCTFLGLHCGYQMWLFGTLSCVFLPFFRPNLSRSQKLQIGVFSIVVIATFMILVTLSNLDLMPKKYMVSPELGKKLYYINALLTFGSIMLYTSVYNQRMAGKNAELQRAADHDYLTGIYNRQRMQKILDSELQAVKDSGEGALSVAIVDLDFFKKVNDTYGHAAGDKALQDVAGIFKKNSSSGLTFGRWGGEEFLLISPKESTYESFVGLLENIRKQIEDHETISGGDRIRLTVSIGAASYESKMSVERLVNIADDRLYSAKAAGKNRVVSQ